MSRGWGILLFVLSGLSFSCREELPIDGGGSVTKPAIRFHPGDYFSFDNWLVGYSGRIPQSHFRSSWTVTDTGVTILGRSRVAVIIDSTFDTNGRLTTRDTVLMQFAPTGDVYQYGFLKNLIAERESLTLTPQWDLVAAFSLAPEQSWVVARLDSTVGARTPFTVSARVMQIKEYVGINLDGVLQAVLAYRIEITSPRLDYSFWFSDSPAAIARVFDDSEVLEYANLRELAFMRRR